MKYWLSLMRVRQYLKNTFVLAPLFFGKGFSDPQAIVPALAAFACFCAAASGIYILNDYFDLAEDRRHPMKRNRPLASGAITPAKALTAMVLLWAAALGTGFWVCPELVALLAFYIVLNILYSVRLKHIAILDLNIIAAGFVLRVLAGSAVTDIEPSLWILLMTYLVAIFLAISKRRTDVVLATSGNEVRRNIDGYSLAFIDTVMGILSAVLIICYILYCLSHGPSEVASGWIYLSVVFVINGILRYLKLALVDGSTFSPTEIVLKDRFLQAMLLCWVGLFSYLLYFGP